MANDEHVAMLKQGVDAWNAWRDENANTYPDFTEAVLFRARLGGYYHLKANLTRANLMRANLSLADLKGADLSEANLRGAYLGGANLSEARLSKADLRGANLREARLVRAELSGANLRRANLTGARLINADLSGANLRVADLAGANLSRADLSGADLSGADLSGGADLRRADLTGANLTRADLSEANLRGANLNNVNLRGASLTEANLTQTDLTGADLREASLFQTVFGNTTLSEVKGLERCRHIGPSIIDLQTLENSGLFPHRVIFLRGVGLPDNLIESLPSLLNEAIQFFSCFISYSSKDEAFAERLHADLQNRGVRCWFAPHDMPIGAKIIDALDEGIRLRQKVLLILSEGAIASDWVEDEVTTAFEEERSRKQLVLFPVRIDDAVIGTSEAWAGKLRARNIGDFTQWKQHDSYQKSFERLMRDLRVESEGGR
jgi:uncharacterized protein YjbI with pentapeptide repeats